MNQVTPNSHRKLIDIPDDAFKALSLKATSEGTNLKNYIEKLLIEIAAELPDAKAYQQLEASRPDGHVMLAAEEQVEFQRRHGIIIK